MAQPLYTVQQVIDRGYQIISHHPTYSQPNRGTTMNSPQYDCSSFMGVINGITSCPATPSMVSEYTAAGYIHINFNAAVALKKGDVLVWNKAGTSGAGNNGHTAMYIGDNQLMHMSGGGACVIPYYDQGWQDILRNPRSGFYPVKWTPYTPGWSTA